MLIPFIRATAVVMVLGTAVFHTEAKAAPHLPRTSAMQFNRVNFGSPTSVRHFVSQPQPTATSSGRYLPWMVQNLYGIRGASQNMAGRALLGCGC